MDERLMRKKMRRDIGSYGWALLIYYLLMNVCVFAAMMIQSAVYMLQSMTSGGFPELSGLSQDALMGNGWGYLVACVGAVLLIRLWKGKPFFSGLWKTENRMTFGAFWRLACIFVSAQLAFQIFATVVEVLLNLLGLSVLEAMQMATSKADTFSMFLYFSLGAPIVEEIVFRGLVLRGLEKYGRRFAIVISALLFGAFHGNLVQSPYAFLVGLVLGYVASEYSIFWAMVLHMLNNLVLGDTLPRLTQGLGEVGAGLVLQGLILGSAITALVLVIRRRKEIITYHWSNPVAWEPMAAFATGAGNIVLLLVMLFNAFSMLFL